MKDTSRQGKGDVEKGEDEDDKDVKKGYRRKGTSRDGAG